MKVVSVHPHRERPWVTLENGELAYADVLVGCDGSAWKDWVTRTSVLKAFGQGDIAEPTGMQIFKYASVLCVDTPWTDVFCSQRDCSRCRAG